MKPLMHLYVVKRNYKSMNGILKKCKWTKETYSIEQLGRPTNVFDLIVVNLLPSK